MNQEEKGCPTWYTKPKSIIAMDGAKRPEHLVVPGKGSAHGREGPAGVNLGPDQAGSRPKNLRALRSRMSSRCAASRKETSFTNWPMRCSPSG